MSLILLFLHSFRLTINHRPRSSFEMLTVWMFPCQMKILNLDHYMIRPLQWLNSWNVTGTVYTLEQKDVSVCCLLWWLSRAVWAEQHELYSVHLNSVPDQPGRKWIYHWIREAKSLLSNIYTVLTGFCRCIWARKKSNFRLHRNRGCETKIFGGNSWI